MLIDTQLIRDQLVDFLDGNNLYHNGLGHLRGAQPISGQKLELLFDCIPYEDAPVVHIKVVLEVLDITGTPTITDNKAETYDG